VKAEVFVLLVGDAAPEEGSSRESGPRRIKPGVAWWDSCKGYMQVAMDRGTRRYRGHLRPK